MNTVQPCSVISSSALAASKRSVSTIVAPARKQVSIPQIWPKVWNSGRQPNSTSSGRKSKGESIPTVTFMVTLSWVSIAPFGRPVVPEVYRITARSSGAHGRWAAIGSARSASRSRRGASHSCSARTVSSGTSAISAPLRPSASSGPAQTRALAPLSRSTYSISPALSSACIGTTTAPSESTAK
jgi:hypothetical protein